MDRETARYIITYFPNLLTETEAMARRHANSLEKLRDIDKTDAKWRLYKKRHWLTDDPNTLKLISNGYEEFELTTATRIYEAVSYTHLTLPTNREV